MGFTYNRHRDGGEMRKCIQNVGVEMSPAGHLENQEKDRKTSKQITHFTPHNRLLFTDYL
jgi:hypothetical protein